MKTHLPSCARSSRCPYIPGESMSRRHARRLKQAVADEPRARRWIEAKGGKLKLLGSGRHWWISVDGMSIEWWPETGRLVVERRYDKPKKAHDVDQLGRAIAKARNSGLTRASDGAKVKE